MIYVLVRDAQDYDECDQMVFASVSKEKVEEKHEELKMAHRILSRFAKMCQHDMELFSKEHPAPPQPDLANLPLRPLVWEGQWKNAYMVEYDKVLKEYNDELTAFRDHLIDQLKANYDFPKELLSEVDGIFWYLRDYSYSVKEVESD